jgi:hypothetical protein
LFKLRKISDGFKQIESQEEQFPVVLSKCYVIKRKHFNKITDAQYVVSTGLLLLASLPRSTFHILPFSQKYGKQG